MPEFVAEHPEDRNTAVAAWEAAEACTGWSGRHHGQVEILRGKVRGGYQGLAFADTEGLYRIEVDTTDAS